MAGIGGKIADFFAELKIKVDTKEIQKIDKQLLNIEKRFLRTANTINRASQKINSAFDSVFSKERRANRERASAARIQGRNTSSTGAFTAAGFFSKESNIRNTLGLGPEDKTHIERLTQRLEKHNVTQARANALIKEAIARRKRHSRAIEREKNSLKELGFIQSRVLSSTKQLIGGFAGAFAAVNAFMGIKNVGQELEGARAGILATSKDSMDLQKSLSFVDKEAVRLGLDLTRTTKDFVKLKAAGSNLTDEQLQEVFLGVAEAGTVLQLTSDDMTGSLRAVVQMLSKGKVNAEDMRQQLQERMPIAFEALKKATGLSGEALEKAMKNGELLADDILPKMGTELRKFAQTNNALNKILETSRVAENRATTALQKFMDTIFKSGFGKALTEFFNTVTVFFGKMDGLGKFLGQTFKLLIRIVTAALGIIAVPLEIISDLFDAISSVIGENNTALLFLAVMVLPKLGVALKAVGTILGMINKRLVLITGTIAAVIVGLLEVIALTQKGTRGFIERDILKGQDIGGDNSAMNIFGNTGVAAGLPEVSLSALSNPALLISDFVRSSLKSDDGTSKSKINVQGDVHVHADGPDVANAIEDALVAK